MTFLQTGLAKAAGATGYQISRSLRFNSADTAYLNRTPASSGNTKTWTWSGWVKRSALGFAHMFNAGVWSGSTPNLQNVLCFTSGDVIQYGLYNGTTNTQQLTTSQVFRDLGAWMHVLMAVDTTQATASNRLKLYVNGVQVTAFSTATYPSLNDTTYINTNTYQHRIGRAYDGDGANGYLNGYLADVRFIDGQALDPTSFGEFDAATGVWVPKAYTGTYGTNGFWLKFDDNSGVTATTLGKDSSGNGNNWTPNNFSVTAGVGNDSLVDSPTWYGSDTGAGGEVRGNYPTWNPLLGPTPLGGTFADGNLSCTAANTDHAHTSMATPTTGKWYWEFTIGSSALGQGVGIALTTSRARDTSSYYYGAKSTGTVGTLYVNGGAGTTYGANYAANDVIGVALDLDSGTLVFYKNGASQGTAATGVTGSYDAVIAGGGGVSMSAYVNFGQRPFAYTAPSGFKALCTTNLPTPAIGASASTLANKNFDVATYTGNGTGQSITSLSFQPDFSWIKGRSGATDHALYDAVRGVQLDLASNTTGAETTQATGLTAFGSNGFTVGALLKLNTLSATYAAWNWNAGNSTVTNTSGSISSQVRANAAAGISVVGFTANGTTGATVGHGLGVAPAMMIFKRRGAVSDWVVYHKALGATKRMFLDTTDAVATTSVYFNNVEPTSSVFTIGSAADINTSTAAMIAYCFAEVTGFSKFGSYTGNGSTDGPFVYCGFRPRFVLVKRTDSATFNWVLFDTARNSSNLTTNGLFPNLANAEAGTGAFDLLSNGFKLRELGTTVNASGGSFIFIAFAESPFNYARAR